MLTSSRCMHWRFRVPPARDLARRPLVNQRSGRWAAQFAQARQSPAQRALSRTASGPAGLRGRAEAVPSWLPPRAATLYETDCPNLRVERAERPYVGCAVKASTEAAEPGERPLCLVNAAQAYEGQGHDMVARLLNAFTFHLGAGAGPPTL